MLGARIKHQYEGMNSSMKYIDPLVAPQVFSYLIHKDFENTICFLREIFYLPHVFCLPNIKLLGFLWPDVTFLMERVFSRIKNTARL